MCCDVRLATRTLVMDGADELPLPQGMPAAAVVEPLPYNYVVNGDGYDKMGYSNTALASTWRTPTVRLSTVYERPKPDHLFDCAPLDKEPGDLLNPPKPTLSKEEKAAKLAAGKAESARRKALSEEAQAAEDERVRVDKWLDARKLDRRGLAVRIGRLALNHCRSITHLPTAMPAEHLDFVSKMIEKALPIDEIEFTAEQAATWIYHSVPLTQQVLKYYAIGAKMSGYSSITKDIYELLMVEELEGSRFADLDEDILEHAKLFARVIRYGPFEHLRERPGAANGWEVIENDELESLEEYLPEKREKALSVVHEGCELELSELAATLYRGQIYLLTHARNKFNTYLENRIRQPTTVGRVKGVERRKELTTFFNAISSAELKKGMKALGLPEGTKTDMLEALITRFAPKRKRKRAGAAAEEGEGEDEEDIVPVHAVPA